MRKICVKFVPRVLGEDQKERRCHDSREMVELINSDPAVFDALLKAGSTAMTQRLRDIVPNIRMLALQDPRRPDRANLPTNFDYSFFFDSTHMFNMHWVPTWQTVNKEYYTDVLREFRNRFRRKSPALFKSGQWHFHQDNAPVHNFILFTDFLTKMGIKTVPQPPYIHTLLPVTFGYSLNSRKNLETVVMRQLRRWKRLWRRSLTRSPKANSLGPSRSCWNGTTSAAGGDYFEGE